MHLFAWRSAFALACLVWLGGTLLGYAAMASADDASPLALDFGDHAQAPAERESWGLFAFILSRNATVYLWLLTGVLCAGVSTFFVLAGNGLALGQVLGAGMASGLPAGALADLLLTHGVLEVGALCIAGAVGFQGMWLVLHWAEGGWRAVRELRLGWVLAFGAAALTVAAGIEAFVTTGLASHANAGGAA